MNHIYEAEGVFDRNEPLTNEKVRDLMEFPLSPVDFRIMSDFVVTTIGATLEDRTKFKRFFSDIAAAAIEAELDNIEDETAIEKINLPARLIGRMDEGKTVKSAYGHLPEFVHFIIEMLDDFTQNVLKPANQNHRLSTNTLYYIGIFADTVEALLFYYPVAYADMEHLGFTRFHKQIVLRQPLVD